LVLELAERSQIHPINNGNIMSRLIGCEVNSGCQIVWKYWFGQPSEMHRISTELGIGDYQQLGGLEDRLILTRSDLRKLEMQIQMLKETKTTHEDKQFIDMIEAIRDFIIVNSDREQFTFEGDL
jgi:hypothetical protein